MLTFTAKDLPLKEPPCPSPGDAIPPQKSYNQCYCYRVGQRRMTKLIAAPKKLTAFCDDDYYFYSRHLFYLKRRPGTFGVPGPVLPRDSQQHDENPGHSGKSRDTVAVKFLQLLQQLQLSDLLSVVVDSQINTCACTHVLSCFY